MTIKSRLFVTFAILVALVVLMGSMLVVFGFQNTKLSEKSMFYYSRLFFWREVHQNFDEQWRSLRYYVILSDETEKEKFEEQYEVITKKIQEAKNPRKDVDVWLKKYKNLNKRVERVFKQGDRSNLFREFSMTFNKDANSLKSEVQGYIKQNSQILSDLEKRIKYLNTFSLIFSLSVGALAIILGALMSILIFKSIAKPLSILQKGTKAIGEGNLEFQINISSPKEIAQVAKSFNKMVGNLRSMQLQIIQMDRMSSIGQLAGGVAHEINNPLTGVLGQSQLLLEKLPKEHPFRGTVERIESAAQRCRRIVRALLDFARDKNYNFQTIDIRDLINESLDFTKTEMESRGIQLINSVPENEVVRVSAGHIQQVFLNIINNAIQAMQKGGRLAITSGKTKDGYLDIAFKDSGMGIKKDNVSHVFDPFFTTKDIGKGTGLGLTISYGIVQRHKGEIIVESEGDGKGSTFIVRIPLNLGSKEKEDDKENSSD